MNVKSLIPWGKNPNADRYTGGANPFLALHREINRVFENFLHDFAMPARMSSPWPQIELSETEDKLQVIADLPGLEERDVDVTLQDGMLTLKGHKMGGDDGRFYNERWEGAFERIIPVGQDVDPEKVKAYCKNGVLTIQLLKRPDAQRQTKRISIS
jgi:HSP20 family protein